MPQMSGLELQQALAERGIELPIIFVTGHGEVPSVVQAFRGGAVDLFEKPVDDRALIERVQAAIEDDRLRRAGQAKAEPAPELDELTPREREAMELLLLGYSIKQIATAFGISVQTAAKHRAKVLAKMNVANDVELLRKMLNEDAPNR